MNNPINNTVFDTRDLIEYIDDLKTVIVDAYNDQNPDNELSEVDEIEEEANEEFLVEYSNEIEEYNKVNSFAEDLSGSPDYTYGESVIHENYWEDYCRELLVDCGYIPADMPQWIEIDYSATANNMSVDYTTATFDGDTYYIRS